ncbi:flavin-binding monooxygenase [Aspergillus eucalypticola CBS 122712]|uniref:Flavin-binding monooxygenase n=1 Tax=Aspergillus eucalypticola (strain CBS 122712 / IBT 29274) TaxID=1448314 RepID=A0A317VVR9_ASPEC|nr:flavin-binding monooxygenase [Aspergillus eucalypticola CBS 122712]PWY77689.1 flavin-binding monooxygenase [Aspergillus eucalypticola CBS 122712]
MASVEGPEIIRHESVTETDPKHLPTVSLGSLINELALSEKAGSQARPAFEIEEHPIDELRPIKVGVIGAGLAGITAGALLPAKLPGLDLRIYEKNSGVGGTWFENTYPGVRCDIPAHVYQSGFEPNTQWSEEFAQGAEIREYWESIARKYDVHKYLRLQQKVDKAVWLPELGKWRVTLQDLGDSNRIYDEDLDVLINAIGHFNEWKLPEYPGRDEYTGVLFHSSHWNHNVDLNGKRIALIGNGASGLQVLPSIQPIAQHVDHYARNRTWIADSFGTSGVRRLEANLFSPEQLESFRDPDTYLAYRKSVEAGYFSRFGAIFKDSPENRGLREKWTELMKSRVGDQPELIDKLIPDFPPNCRRPTPGPGYLEALTKDNVSYIQTPIQRFTSTGIVTTDGIERPVDIVICSTGANVDHAPPFSIVSNGIDLKKAWKHDGLYGFPYNYLGVATPGFPNLLWLGGPHSTGPSGSVPNALENQVTYIAKLLRKIRSQGIKAMEPSKQATDDFVEYCDKFYPRTVWTANDDSTPGQKNCSSWYNGGRPGGKVHGQFPGSAAALNYLRRDPRWEDWDYSYTNPSGNRFAFLGNGWTTRETLPDADLTPHLKRHDTIDLKTYLEGWWDV